MRGGFSYLRSRFLGLLLAVMTWAAVPLSMLAQSPGGAAAAPDLSGIWLLAGGMNEWETRGRRAGLPDRPVEKLEERAS